MVENLKNLISSNRLFPDMTENLCLKEKPVCKYHGGTYIHIYYFILMISRIFKRKKYINFSIGILIWRIFFFFCRHSFSVPYFHYLEDNRLMWQRNGGQHQLHVVICVHGLGWYSFSRKKIFNYLKIQFWFDEIFFLEF